MGVLWNLARVVLVSTIIVVVAEISKRHPRVGALLISLPIVSILAFVLGWFQHHDLPAISKLARETLVLVPLGLPFFIPFALAPRLGMNFWTCFATGTAVAALAIFARFAWFPET